MQPNQWFEKRRHLFIRNMVREFHQTVSRFIAIYNSYLETGRVSFARVDHLVGRESDKGLLWHLKDRCHQLWREADPQEELNGCLLDWVLGSLFHEAMKLKENIYMSQYYGPLAEDMEARQRKDDTRFCGIECHRFMVRARQEIEKQIDNLGFMFNRARFLLRAMMPEQAGNPLLVRYLVENRDLPEELWAESLASLLTDMFGSPDTGYCVAARSYLEGQWLEQAAAAYEEALRHNRACEEARRNLLILGPLIREQGAQENRTEPCTA